MYFVQQHNVYFHNHKQLLEHQIIKDSNSNIILISQRKYQNETENSLHLSEK